MVTSAAVAALALSGGLARRGAVSVVEERVFRFFNDGPDLIGGPVWMVMQTGSFGAVLVAAGAAAGRGRRRQALLLAGGGTAAWLGVKAVKPLVGRGRPAACLAAVKVRGRPQTGLGYPSGHAAVVTTLALLVAPQGDRRVGLVIAGITSCARMYSGAHLPLDVVGGAAIGRLVADLAIGSTERVLRP